MAKIYPITRAVDANAHDPLANAKADCMTMLPTASQWLAEPDEEEIPSIKGCFDRGDRIACVGQSKSKKSFFALQMAVCFATGSKFLGYDVERQKTLMINGEIKPTKYKKRLRGILHKLGIPPDELDLLTVYNTRDLPADMNSIESILQLCIDGQFTVCIIDPSYVFFADENDQREVKATIQRLKEFSREKITLVTMYHSAKGLIGDRQAIDRISGSGIFARDADALISLALHEDGQSVVIEWTLRGYPEQPKQTIAFNSGCFEVSDIAPLEKTSRSRPKRDFDMASVAKSVRPGMNYTAGVNAIKVSQSVGRDKARELFALCLSQELIVPESEGRTTTYHQKLTQATLAVVG
jgi:hypothetical protein